MESKTLRSIFIIALLFFVFFKVCDALSQTILGNEKQIRVAVLKDASDFTISARGGYKIINPVTSQILHDGRLLRLSRVTAVNNHIAIGEEEFAWPHIRITSDKDVTIHLKDKATRYRGDIDIYLNDEEKFLVVNSLELEQYIRGVLYHEVTNRWPVEAIKAQAVAVRTYALYQIDKNKGGLYDLTNDIYSQVYGGRSAERYRTNIATTRTKGEVMLYQGEILPAYFHSTCGGHTEDALELGWEDLAPLKGIKCDFCKFAPLYNWKKNFRLKDVQDKLNAKGYRLGPIKDIKILDRTASGRIKRLQIIQRDGRITTIPGKDFRLVIGPNDLKSNFYNIAIKGYYFDVIGRGWGHGVGMCQWGALEMSREHYKYKEILQYYYPGVDIVDSGQVQ